MTDGMSTWGATKNVLFSFVYLIFSFPLTRISLLWDAKRNTIPRHRMPHIGDTFRFVVFILHLNAVENTHKRAKDKGGCVRRMRVRHCVVNKLRTALWLIRLHHLNIVEWMQWAFETQLRIRPHARAVISVIKPNNHSATTICILCGYRHVSDADPLAPQSSQISQSEKRRTNESRTNKTNNRKMPLRRCYPADCSCSVVRSALRSHSI